MDPLTQGLLGAAAAQAAFGRTLPRSAAVIGFGAAVLPDLDVLFRVANDPVASMLLHRHFTHALLFIPIGGLLAAALFLPWPMFRGRRWAVLGAATLAYATHGLLDAATSYGTLLYWPFSSERVAWDFIAIIDPLFTLPLLAAVVWALAVRSPRPAAVGLVLALAYIGLGGVQNERGLAAQRELAAARGHTIERGRAMPTLGNLLVWRSVYEADGQLHADALRLGLPGQVQVREGAAAPRLDPADLTHLSPPAQQTLAYFAYFADGYLARVPGHDQVIGDMRYAARTESLLPLWALRLDVPGHDRPQRVGLRIDRAAALRQLWRDVTVGLEEH